MAAHCSALHQNPRSKMAVPIEIFHQLSTHTYVHVDNCQNNSNIKKKDFFCTANLITPIYSANSNCGFESNSFWNAVIHVINNRGIIIIIIGIYIAPFPFIKCSKALHIVIV